MEQSPTSYILHDIRFSGCRIYPEGSVIRVSRNCSDLHYPGSPDFQSLDRPQRPQNTPPASMGPLQNAHFRKSTSSFWVSTGRCLSYLLATSKAPSIKRIMGVNNRMSETGFPSGVTTPVST